MKTFFSFLIVLLFFASGVSAQEKLTLDELRQQYKKTSYPTLLDLYWKNSRLNTGDVNHIDYYLKVKECDLTKKHYANDFEWKKIREATVDHLKKYRKGLSNKIYFVQPLELSEYDFERGGFKINQDYQYREVKRMRISDNQPGMVEECLKAFPSPIDISEIAPLNAIASLTKPFTFEFLPLKEDVAKLYLEYLKEQNFLGNNRPAYIFIYMDVLNYLKDTVNYGVDGFKTSEFKTKIALIEVYTDLERKYPLYIKVMDN